MTEKIEVYSPKLETYVEVETDAKLLPGDPRKENIGNAPGDWW